MSSIISYFTRIFLVIVIVLYGHFETTQSLLPVSVRKIYEQMLKKSQIEQPNSKISDLNFTVIGGQDAEDGAAPFIVSLKRDGRHTCGGSILTRWTVVTAAHCTFSAEASQLSIHYGSNQRTKSDYEDIPVAKIAQHENFNFNNLNDDISLLILSKPVEVSDKVAMIQIEMDEPSDGSEVTLYGWGLTDSARRVIPENLQVGKMSLVSNQKCNAKWGQVNAITDKMVCALDETQAACNGDSGGPLLSENKLLLGIVSWGPPGCPPGEWMSVYTRAGKYCEWIHKNKK